MIWLSLRARGNRQDHRGRQLGKRVGRSGATSGLRCRGAERAPLPGGEILREETVHVPVPSVDAARCDGCGKCSDFCAYGAIVAPGGTAMVFPNSVDGCGGCEVGAPATRHPGGRTSHRNGGNAAFGHGDACPGGAST